jgi:uncharacterized protein (DUF58 family)
VRETEWEAAQTVCLWRDGGPAMRWKSRGAPVAKADRAGLILLALAALLLRGGERVRLIAPDSRAVAGRAGLDRIADALERLPDTDGLPPPVQLPRHSRVVLVGDLLAPLDRIEAEISRLAALPVSGTVLQVLDPAEAILPYEGRVRFEGIGGAATALIPRVESVREQYAQRLAAQQDGIARICAAVGWGFSIHRTDHPPEAALLALYTSLGPRSTQIEAHR